MKHEDAQRIASKAINIIADAGCKVDVFAVGSLRREMNYVTDIDLVAPWDPTLIGATERLFKKREIIKWRYGDPDDYHYRWGQKLRGFALKRHADVKIELFMYNTHNRGYITWLRTGPGKAGKYVMQWLKYTRAPFYFEDGYGWTDGKKLSLPTEHDVFTLLGIEYIVPRLRNDSTYKMLFERKSHTWGDPTPFILSEPTQPSLF